MESAQTLHRFFAGPQVQMIGVAENNIRTGRLDVFGQHRLYRRRRAHRHERRRADDAVRGGKLTGAGEFIFFVNGKIHFPEL